MDSIHPWLDADELKQLAESLMQGGRAPLAPLDHEAVFSDSFVGFAAAPRQAAAPSPITVTPHPAPATPGRQADPEPSPVAVPQGEPSAPAVRGASPAPSAATWSEADAHCLQLQSRLSDAFGAERIFILNRDGHTVFGKEHHPHLQFIARSLTRDAERRGLPKGHIHIKVGPGQVLEIVPVSLPNGGWVVGSVVPQPLGPAEIKSWVTEISRLSSILNQL